MVVPFNSGITMSAAEDISNFHLVQSLLQCNLKSATREPSDARIKFPRWRSRPHRSKSALNFLPLNFSRCFFSWRPTLSVEQIDHRIEVFGIFLRGHRQTPGFDSDFAVLPIFVDRENQMDLSRSASATCRDARICARRNGGSRRSARHAERSPSLAVAGALAIRAARRTCADSCAPALALVDFAFIMPSLPRLGHPICLRFGRRQDSQCLPIFRHRAPRDINLFARRISAIA